MNFNMRYRVGVWGTAMYSRHVGTTYSREFKWLLDTTEHAQRKVIVLDDYSTSNWLWMSEILYLK